MEQGIRPPAAARNYAAVSHPQCGGTDAAGLRVRSRQCESQFTSRPLRCRGTPSTSKGLLS